MVSNFNFPVAPPNLLNPTSLLSSQPDPGGFIASVVPSESGFGTRQSRIANFRPAVNTRKIIHWLVPEQPMVQMYINPQNIRYNYRKGITPQRTKGGFMVQYWGEELTGLTINGTTGTSGIEGINVLSDVYRSEQLAIDPYALFLAATQDESLLGGIGAGLGGALGGGLGASIGSSIGGALNAGLQSASPFGTTPTPSLAQQAFTVEMYWSGEVYRGYFTAFTVTESSTNLGMFDYDIEFTATQKRGFRQNFLAWHRSATSGPSRTDPRFGTPYSYGVLVPGEAMTPQASSPVLSGITSAVTGSILGF